MKLKIVLLISLVVCSLFAVEGQSSLDREILAKIKAEGFANSQAMSKASQLIDIYGQRLTGSREYLAAAQWMSEEMKSIGLQNVKFEPYCPECRGWSMRSFNLEMTAPNYMHLTGFPLAMTQSTDGLVKADLVYMESYEQMDTLRRQYAGTLKDKIILLGKVPEVRYLMEAKPKRFSMEEMRAMEELVEAQEKSKPIPELLREWDVEDIDDQDFLRFVAEEGALGILSSNALQYGILAGGTYYAKNGNLKPIPYFSIMPEHFGRLYRLIQQGVVPQVQIQLETEFYHEPENNVNVIGEITGEDTNLKSQQIMIGAHFDSWHAGTGATDNGGNCIVLLEALRILKSIGYRPKRTIVMGLWGGEEQSFFGSVAYARAHFGPLEGPFNATSKNVSAYLNLDNGIGQIRGLYLQENQAAKPVFKDIFAPISDLTDGILTIENNFYTDHHTFDHYNIPSFQFIQDPMDYRNATHHTDMDLFEYVSEKDMVNNAIILAWTIYSLSERELAVPRKREK